MQVRDGSAAWNRDFFERVGLGDLAEEGFRRLGTDVVRYLGGTDT